MTFLFFSRTYASICGAFDRSACSRMMEDVENGKIAADQIPTVESAYL